ncbi:MAG: NHLP leader peptide family RiPP precursor [Lactobacillales bacterium]|jgi:hypothetical protein|nr:NHLP leader peptide family RiPP precursor [Lactobacillales bacterium]
MDMMKVYNQVIARVKEDEQFKKEILTNPKAALKNTLGVEIEDDITIEFFESTPEHYHFVLPAIA